MKKNGGKMTVCATRSMGKVNPTGEEAKIQVKAFLKAKTTFWKLPKAWSLDGL